MEVIGGNEAEPAGTVQSGISFWEGEVRAV